MTINDLLKQILEIPEHRRDCTLQAYYESEYCGEFLYDIKIVLDNDGYTYTIEFKP